MCKNIRDPQQGMRYAGLVLVIIMAVCYLFIAWSTNLDLAGSKSAPPWISVAKVWSPEAETSHDEDPIQDRSRASSDEKAATKQQLRQFPVQVDPGNTTFIVRPSSSMWSAYDLRPRLFNMGFPKSGSSSWAKLSACFGLKTSHYFCGKRGKGATHCGHKIRNNLLAGRDPLWKLDFDAFMQMDSTFYNCYFPQIELLELWDDLYPGSIFVLATRNASQWVSSVTRFWKNGKLRKGYTACNITGLPSGVGEDDELFMGWYLNHSERVRSFFLRRAPTRFFEISLSDDPAEVSQKNTILALEHAVAATFPQRVVKPDALRNCSLLHANRKHKH